MPPIATLFFEPLDVLLFRDHRPFMAGQHFLARSTFPRPSVFFGAIRAALFERADVRFGPFGHDPFSGLSAENRALLGDASATGALELAGPLLARRSPKPTDPLELLLPWPRDLDPAAGDPAARQLKDAKPVVRKYFPAYPQGAPGTSLRLHVQGKTPSVHELPLLPKSDLPRDGKPEKKRRRLTHEGALRYARATAAGQRSVMLTDHEHVVDEESVLEREYRTGHARTRAEDPGSADPLTVEESMLYTVEALRLAPGAGFLVDLSLSADKQEHEPRLRALLASLDRAIVRLGGKGHLARVTCHAGEHSPLDKLRQEITKLQQVTGEAKPPPAGLKAWCLTPSLVDPERHTMILGDTTRLGGINLQKPRGPRPLLGALSPGSVVFLREEASRDQKAREEDEKAAYARGLELGHPRRAGYGVHFLLPFSLPTSPNRPHPEIDP